MSNPVMTDELRKQMSELARLSAKVESQLGECPMQALIKFLRKSCEVAVVHGFEEGLDHSDVAEMLAGFFAGFAPDGGEIVGVELKKVSKEEVAEMRSEMEFAEAAESGGKKETVH